MEYSNPKIPEGINVTPIHPLVDFAQLVGGILLGAALVFWLLGLAADQLVTRIPFAYEQGLAAPFEHTLGPSAKEIGPYQALGERLAAVMGLPGEMTIRVHVVDDPRVNALATLGGHVVLFRGLLDRLDSENAVAMVLAHEIAHIKRRHPIRSLGRALVVGLAIAMAAGASGNDLAGTALGDAGLLTVLAFSRGQERQADEDALEAVYRLYGHLAGALDLYRALREDGGGAADWQPAFLRTHPHTGDRIAELERLAGRRGWTLQGERLPPVGVVTGVVNDLPQGVGNLMRHPLHLAHFTGGGRRQRGCPMGPCDPPQDGCPGFLLA